MVAEDALHGDWAAAAADELFGGGTGLQAFFDHTVPEVKGSGRGSDDEEEELEWLSNKDAFPTVETMDSRPRTEGVRQSRAVVACRPAEGWQCRHCGTQSTPQWREGPMGPRTLCNACGIKHRAGRLLPEYRPANSPTFSSALHSNRHHRIEELRRLRSMFLAADTMAPTVQRPRTKGLQRPRKVLAWSPPPPPPPRTPAQERVLGSGDDGGGADEGCAAAPAGGGGVDDTAPRGLAVAGPRRSQGGRDGTAVEQGRVPGGGDDGDAAALPTPAGAVVPAPWDGDDGAVALGARREAHAVQRVWPAVQRRWAGASVPAGEQPELLLDAALQQAPHRPAPFW